MLWPTILVQKAQAFDRQVRREMVDKNHPSLSVGAQCRLLSIYQKPDTSKPAKGHKTYPSLLGGLRVERPHQVWCADITYTPMRRGILYLAAIMDWYTRKVFDALTRPHWGHGPISPWRISNTLEADFCVEALNEAIHKFGPPEIMNTDQGSQFTSFVWTDGLKRVGTRISMDGKGRCISFYNTRRPHTAHGGQPPAVVYFHAIATDQQMQAVA